MVENVRWSNPFSMESYAAYVTRQETADLLHRQILTPQEQMEEYMFLGLRMVCGVSAAAFARTFGIDVIRELHRQGLLVREGDRIRLTRRGLDVSNYAMAQFLFD